jgi:hypothetical protein
VADFFHFVPGYEHYVYQAGREPLFFLLLAFLLTFAAVRSYTRLGRARGWGSGSVRGVHLHHLVPGIVASLAAGTAIIGFHPGDDSMLLLSALFGVGAALTLDEFALILHLDDVYWAKEGRGSIEATLMGFTFAALCLLVTAPLGSDPGKDVPHWALGGFISVNMAFARPEHDPQRDHAAAGDLPAGAESGRGHGQPDARAGASGRAGQAGADGRARGDGAATRRPARG